MKMTLKKHGRVKLKLGSRLYRMFLNGKKKYNSMLCELFCLKIYLANSEITCQMSYRGIFGRRAKLRGNWMSEMTIQNPQKRRSK